MEIKNLEKKTKDELVAFILQLQSFLDKKELQIDLYIEELICNEFDRCCQECCRECEKDKDALRICIKQYFERKIEDVKN